MANFFVCPDFVEYAGHNALHYLTSILYPLISERNDHSLCVDNLEIIHGKYDTAVRTCPSGVLSHWLMEAYQSGSFEPYPIADANSSVPEIGVEVLAQARGERFIIVSQKAQYDACLSGEECYGIECLKENLAEKVLSQQASLLFDHAGFRVHLLNALKGMIALNRKQDTEEPRNALLKHSLEMAGVDVEEKGTGGVSETRKTQGERDLVINSEFGAVTLIEAVRASSVSPTGENPNLVKHINKLIMNYNPAKHPTLYHVIYYEGEEFEVGWKNYLSFLKELEGKNGYCGGRVTALKQCSELAKDTKGVRVATTDHAAHDGVKVYHYFCNFFVPSPDE